MPAGFQTYTNDGTTQIGSDDLLLSLWGKLTLTTADTWSQEGNNSAYHDIEFADVSGEWRSLVGLHSAAPVWASCVSAAPLIYRVYRIMSGSAPVEVFFYSSQPPLPNASASGLEVFGADGSLLYASEQPVARPIGRITDAGYTGLSIAGRKLAIAPQKMGHYNYNSWTHGGLGSCNPGGPSQQGYRVYQAGGWSRTAISADRGRKRV